MNHDTYHLEHVTYTDKAGNRHESPFFTIRFKDHAGMWQRIPTGTANERHATGFADRLMRLLELRRNSATIPEDLAKWLDTLGEQSRRRIAACDLIDAVAAAAERPLIDHLDGQKDAAGKVIEPGYTQALEARGTTANHIGTVTHRVRTILEECALTHWRELNAPSAATRVEVWLGEQRAKAQISGTTYNYYVRDLRSFCKWLANQGRAPGLAMQTLQKVGNAGADAERRRALSVDEMHHLVDAAAQSTVIRQGIAGDDRALLYRFAFETGMRPGQIRALTVKDFDLTADPPTVTTQAQFVKRRKVHVQELRPALAKDLAQRFKVKMPDAPAFKMPPVYDLTPMLRADLADARAAWIKDAGGNDNEKERRQRSDFLAEVNHAGEVTVFYSTRHGHGTALAAAGVPEKDIAASMHHANRTTTTRYLHGDRDSRHAAIGKLPDLEPQRQIATGTDGRTPDPAPEAKTNPARLPNACQIGAVSSRFDALKRQIEDAPISLETPENAGDNAKTLLSPVGLEPTTYGLKVRCSTN